MKNDNTTITADSEELEKALEEFVAVRLPKSCAAAMEQACLVVEADSKKNCPVQDGTLRESITHAVEEDEDGEAIIGYIGSNVEYAPYIHQGTGIYATQGNGRKEVPWTYFDEKTGEFVSTSGIQPTPFIQDAVDKNRAGILTYFGGIVDDN